MGKRSAKHRDYCAFDRDESAAVRRSVRDKWLNDRGITYSLIYTNDVLGNLSGGIRTGTIDQGKLETQLLVDLEKLAGWKNWSFYANAFGIYNDGRIRRDYVGGINTIAAIEATPTVRLSELWLERWAGPVSFRFGQLAADAEFFYSDLSQIFLQSDWPTIAAVNLPGGGPAYPLSAVGARIKYEFPKDASPLLAIFNGDPAGPCSGDPDTCNRYGLNFRISDPAFMIGELQFRRNRGKHDTDLATTLKAGRISDNSPTSDTTTLAFPWRVLQAMACPSYIVATTAFTESSTSSSIAQAAATATAAYRFSHGDR
jgi:porin